MFVKHFAALSTRAISKIRDQGGSDRIGGTAMADRKTEAALALHRFGFGPRAGSIAAIAADPRAALLADLDRPDAGRLTGADLLTGSEAARAAFDFREVRKAARLAEREAAKAASSVAGRPANQADTPPAMTPASPKPNGNPGPAIPQQIYRQEAKVRIDAALNAEIGFAERLAWFWSNHFCVSADKTGVRPLAGAYEREAIRPHVLGKFADLVLAAEGHPAMLIYLDNASSMGANSIAGINRTRGINENLAREILELHTLGVRTDYTQEDVTNFAKVLTGWTIYTTDNNPDHGGEFLFHPRMHEPGAQAVIGKAYRDTGVEQGRAVLADLARHPATALHVATKLARHFIADEPPPALVETLRQKFIETDGDLWQVSQALVTAPESWAPEQAKIKRPSEWRISYQRAAGFNAGDVRANVGTMNRLGEPLWRPPAPKGFPDENGAWIDGLAHRLDTANAFAQNPNNAERLDPRAMLEAGLGPLASAETRSAVNRAETKQQAMALLLMAPEFQRR
jgi:uncharacterized protein (DUF1800 family)